MADAYVKVEVGKDMIYYIHTENFPNFFKEYLETPSRSMIARHAEIAIDVRNNELVKCRQTLEYLIDNGFPKPVMKIKFDESVK